MRQNSFASNETTLVVAFVVNLSIIVSFLPHPVPSQLHLSATADQANHELYFPIHPAIPTDGPIFLHRRTFEALELLRRMD